MKKLPPLHRICEHICFGWVPFGALGGHFSADQTHSSPCPHQLPARHPQIGQRKQSHQLRRVLGKTTVAHLGESKLALDDTKRVLHLDPHACLELLSLLGKRTTGRLLLLYAFARAHGHLPLHARGFGALGCPLVARVSKYNLLISMQQPMTLRHIIDVGRCFDDGVYQAGVRIQTNVGLHAEMPLVALLYLMHLGVTLALAVLGRTGRSNQCGIDDRASLEHQAFGCQGGVNGGQQLDAEVVFFQQMAEPQDGGLIGQTPNAGVQVGKLAVQRNVLQCLFHGRIRQAKPLLQEVNAQHGVHRKWRALRLARRCERLDQRNQLAPRNNQIHLVKKFALACYLGDQLKPAGGKAFLFHRQLTSGQVTGLTYADLP